MKRTSVTANLDPNKDEDLEKVDPKRVPSSARLKFEITAPKEIKELPAFATLAEEAGKFNKQAQIQYAKYIYRSIQLTIDHHEKSSDNNLADTLYHMALAYVSDGSTDQTAETTRQAETKAHLIAVSCIENYNETILTHANKKDKAEFKELYRTHHSLGALPNATAPFSYSSPARILRNGNPTAQAQAQPVGDGSIFGNDGNELLTQQPPQINRTLPSDVQTTMADLIRKYDSLLVSPMTIYLQRVQDLQKGVAMKKLETDIFTKKATEDADMQVNEQTAVSPELLLEMIQKEATKLQKPLLNEIKSLKKQMASSNGRNNNHNNNNTNNNPRSNNPKGRRGRSRSKSKSRGNSTPRGASKNKEKANKSNGNQRGRGRAGESNNGSNKSSGNRNNNRRTGGSRSKSPKKNTNTRSKSNRRRNQSRRN